jgi:hypothetical protein
MLFCGVLAGLLGPAVPPSAAVEPRFVPKPAWNIPEAMTRLLVEQGGDDFILVEIPAQTEGKPVAAVRAFVASNEVPTKVLWASAKLSVLVDARSAGKSQFVRVYPVPGAAPAAAGAGSAADPLPIRGTAARTAGMDYPETLAQLRQLATRFDTPVKEFGAATFEGLKESFKEWYRGDWTRKSHLVHLQTWISVPTNNTQLAFGLASIAPVWLLVDGQEAVEHPAGKPFDQWTVGKAVRLSAGLHRLEALTVCREAIDTGVAWKHPGGATLASEVTMVTGVPLRSGRWERRDRSVQPFAEAEFGHAYRFAGTDELFIPCELADKSASWGGKAEVSWLLGGKPVGEGPKLSLILRASQLPAAAEVKVSAKELGESRSFTLPLAYDGPVWAENYVSTRVAGVPAICDTDDRVHAMVRMRTSAPDGMAFEIASSTHFRDGSVSNRSERVTTDQGWARVYVAPFAAGDVSEVSWSLLHDGVALSKGRARFLREPFDVLPDSVSGETLKAGGDFLILVTSRAAKLSGKEPAAACGPWAVALSPESIPPLAPWLLKFPPRDAQASGAPDSPQPAAPAPQAAAYTPQAASDSSTGVSWLEPFTAISNALPASLFVYAPAFRAADLADPAAFERRVSAFTGLLASPAAGSPRVVLVVPPEPDILPDCGCAASGKPCPHAERAREFAEAVIRVADTHGLETIDLFTAFRTAADPSALIRGGRLTDQGRALAARLVQEKLSAL